MTLCNYLSHYFSKSPTGKWNQQIKNNSVWSFLRFFKVFFFIIVGPLRFWNIEFGNPCSKHAVSNAHSVTVILTGKICEKAFRSFTGLTGRCKEGADNVEMRPRGVSWPRLALGASDLVWIPALPIASYVNWRNYLNSRSQSTHLQNGNKIIIFFIREYELK